MDESWINMKKPWFGLRWLFNAMSILARSLPRHDDAACVEIRRQLGMLLLTLALSLACEVLAAGSRVRNRFVNTRSVVDVASRLRACHYSCHVSNFGLEFAKGKGLCSKLPPVLA